MRPWVRRGVGGALLVCLAGFLVFFTRLDGVALRRQIVEQLEQTTTGTVHGGKAELSLQNGVSLNIPHLDIDGKDGWALTTDAVHINIGFWSLLFGHLSIDSVDMIRPVVHLAGAVSPAALFASPYAGKLLQGAPVLSFRQGSILVGKRVLTDEVDATVRRVDREQQTSWEVQSRYAGGDFSSQGYIRSTNSGHSKVFGRITASHLQLARMQPLSPNILHYDRLDASLTFSLEDGRIWEWSGNLSARDEHDQLPALSWRGKIAGSSASDFSLRDAFLQFADGTRLALSGGCESSRMCRLGVGTKSADLGVIRKALGVALPMQGKLSGTLVIRREAGSGWRLAGDFGLRDVTWAKTGLPDSQVHLADMLVGQAKDFEIGRAVIRPGGRKGSIEFDGIHWTPDSFHMRVHLDGLDGAWVPLGNIILKQPEFSALLHAKRLDGRGVLDGTMDWTSARDASHLLFSLAAKDAAIALGKVFVKPAGIAAEVSGSYRKKGEQWWLDLSSLHLGDSRLDTLQMDASTSSPKLSFAGASLNLSVLKAQGVLLPKVAEGWRGGFAGGLQGIVLHKAKDLRQDLAAAHGILHLDGFGRDGQSLSGEIELRQGRVLARRMRWQHASDMADFDADMGLSDLHGRVDIDRAAFQWSPQDSLPAWLMDVDIHGGFKRTKMLWNGNAWGNLRGAFAARDGQLVLHRVRGWLGGGRVGSRSMTLDSIPGGIRFSGRIGMSAVYLDKVEGLIDTIGAKPGGYAFVNASLSGSLPVSSGPGGAGWRGNGDIEIRNGGVLGTEAGHSLYWQNGAAERLLNQSGHRFDLFAFHFVFRGANLRMVRLQIETGEAKATGEVSIAAGGKISGRIAVRRGNEHQESALGGRWPSLARLVVAPKTEP